MAMQRIEDMNEQDIDCLVTDLLEVESTSVLQYPMPEFGDADAVWNKKQLLGMTKAQLVDGVL